MVGIDPGTRSRAAVDGRREGARWGERETEDGRQEGGGRGSPGERGRVLSLPFSEASGLGLQLPLARSGALLPTR